MRATSSEAAAPAPPPAGTRRRPRSGVVGALSGAEERRGGAALRWHVIVDHPAPAAWNMALDHALVSTLEDGEAVLRFYGWDPGAVSFGRHEPAVGRYSPEVAASEGIEVVRRPTGGRAVLHRDEVTYAVALPGTSVRALGGVRAVYRLVHLGIADGLRALGVEARVAQAGSRAAGVISPPAGRGRAAGTEGPEGRVLPLDAGPCFQAPAPGEVVVQGRKLVGSAQARLDGGVLQHGSILLDGDQSLVDRMAGRTGGDTSSALTLADLLGDTPPRPLVIEAMIKGMRGTLGGRGWDRSCAAMPTLALARRLEARYASPEWTWRR